MNPMDPFEPMIKGMTINDPEFGKAKCHKCGRLFTLLLFNLGDKKNDILEGALYEGKAFCFSCLPKRVHEYQA